MDSSSTSLAEPAELFFPVSAKLSMIIVYSFSKLNHQNFIKTINVKTEDSVQNHMHFYKHA